MATFIHRMLSLVLLHHADGTVRYLQITPMLFPLRLQYDFTHFTEKKKRQTILYCFLEPFLILCLPRKCKPYQLELTLILQWHVIFVYMRERGQRIHLPNDVLLRLTNIQITCILGILPAGKWRMRCEGGKLLSDSNLATFTGKQTEQNICSVCPSMCSLYRKS